MSVVRFRLPRSRDFFSVRFRNFVLCLSIQTGTGFFPTTLFNVYRGAERFIRGYSSRSTTLNHPPPLSVESKIDWKCTSTSPYVLTVFYLTKYRDKLVCGPCISDNTSLRFGNQVTVENHCKDIRLEKNI